MADIFKAELDPGKFDVVSAWLSRQEWTAGADVAPDSLTAVTSYRFDDPAGDVGVEIHIVAADDRVFQVPLTYRGEPLAGADDVFISEMSHSILGTRYVYAGIGDPVFQQQLDATIADAGSSAVQHQVDDQGNRIGEITEVARVVGTGPLPGAPSVQVVDELDLNEAADTTQQGLLIGTWDGQETPVVLARMI
ncbi:maltokinase N-terminal cap-like domain-containing protein [Brevibacterium marinum]|uniref:Maltokinase N-terminal cap domain-containing protein n=1 Tax=Brevibacterium marinum TaxID=418643 RepID=A0A846S5T0_9MICO|nr:hypothetical protein [Brevibacterium marinum]NJC56832.1 hypothetical protein [Brevibacterium marinum]